MKLSAINQAVLGLATSVRTTIEYSTVTGYFLQDESSTDASTFDYTSVNFGLINRTCPADQELRDPQSLTQWERFHHQVQRLNQESPQNVEYKVLFLGRHGEGWHNAAETFYGTPAWNCYWAERNGNSTATWDDASLTEVGITQALAAHDFWQTQINKQRIHTPDTFYVSPLTRTLQTANLTFTNLTLPKHSAPFTPLIKELFREGITIHTCDHRRSKTYIASLFPDWPIEPGFTEKDELWNGVTAETRSAQDDRSRQALSEVFFTGDSSKEASFVSVTSHSGEIASLLRVVGHRAFGLRTGAVLPVLVRAVKTEGSGGGGGGVTASSASWTTSAYCTQPPVTSVSACVCPSSAVLATMPVSTGF